MQDWVHSHDSLTTIHTWTHLALATHMKSSQVNDLQVAPTTLKTQLTGVWWHTKSLKACQLPSS